MQDGSWRLQASLFFSPRGWEIPKDFQHSCHLKKGKKSVFIGKQRIKDQNTEVKWENNEAKQKTGIPGWPVLTAPKQHSHHHRISPSSFPFLVSGWSWQLLALLSYLGKQCLSKPNSVRARDISEKNKWGLARCSTCRWKVMVGEKGQIIGTVCIHLERQLPKSSLKPALVFHSN